jgi:NADH-quinone oxidoreductase subunit A
MSQFISIIDFLILSILLVLGLSFINILFFLHPNSKEGELRTTYECGFVPFINRRLNFNINFHTIAILFIIFDLEILLIFPWSVAFLYLGLIGFYTMIFFFLILLVGLFFEFKANVLIL